MCPRPEVGWPGGKAARGGGREAGPLPRRGGNTVHVIAGREAEMCRGDTETVNGLKRVTPQGKVSENKDELRRARHSADCRVCPALGWDPQ